ncbi:hypothetical protein PHMEG_00035503 [Phytophthora megakarya]|uniref:Uncharacterized protein n=1 Tax=Phytophthora megakarya TaxID=4795 RepID=A0A225UNV8_9STRA|nr:hypothetical protein PHMEG_00035503 [Phytophthora megakarya]
MNRNITAYFFEGLGDSHFRRKICCTTRNKHLNRIGHLTAKKNNYQVVYDTATTSQTLGTFGFMSETTSS